MTNVLAVDTSTYVNTVALCQGEHLLAETAVAARRLHSERLVETIDWVLGEAGLPLTAVDLLAVAVGPGSFTGLRIGVATMKGIALGADLPLVGVPTLAAMSRLNGFPEGCLCPMLDARMQEVFCAAFELSEGRRVQVREDRVCPVEEFLDTLETIPEPIAFLGDGATLYRDVILERRPQAMVLPEYLGMPRAAAVAREALAMRARGAPSEPGQVAPVYLRASQAEENRARAQARAGAAAS